MADSDIDGESDDGVDVVKAGRGKPCPKPTIRTTGPLQIMVVVMSLRPSARWPNAFFHDSAYVIDLTSDGGECVVGFALAQWNLEKIPVSSNDTFYSMIRVKSRSGIKKRYTCVGYLTWRVIEYIWSDCIPRGYSAIS